MFTTHPSSSLQKSTEQSLSASNIDPAGFNEKGRAYIWGEFDKDVRIPGIVVVQESKALTCGTLYADCVVVAGAILGNIVANKVEIRANGRIWGDLVTIAFSTEEGAFFRGQITLTDSIS